MTLKIERTALPGVCVIETQLHHDARGFLTVTFHAEQFAAAGLPTQFPQENHSRSSRGVVRGLHFQSRHPQGKLVSVTHGEIFDVAVDVRIGSPTFGKWVGEHLSANSPRQMWIPAGFAHGFSVLSDSADVTYKCTSLYDASDQCGVRWNDPALDIPWPDSDPIVSDADRVQPFLADASATLPRYVP